VVWKTTPQDLAALNVMKLPQVQTRLLFDATTEEGGRWTAGVLQEKHIQMIKESLVQFKSPVVVNYNQGNYWHVVVIVGYDDEQVVQDRRVENALKGKLLPHWRKQIQKSLQSAGGQLRRKGVFYVRDSGGCGNGRGQPYSIRSYDWFKYLGNAAFVPYLSQ
jgi:hypothetical protein